MPFKIKFADITQYKGDAIVNSLGINGKVKGALCNAILKASGSEELATFINSKTHNKVGDIYVTEGYNLFANNIIHVVSPFKNMDDENNTKLKEIYESIINKAIELGYYKIALPFLGTGANGYLDSDAYEAVTTVCANLVEKEDEKEEDLLEVTLIVRGNQKLMSYQQEKDYLNERLERGYPLESITIFKNKKYDLESVQYDMCSSLTKNPEGNKLKKNTIKCVKVFNDLNPNNFFIPKMLPYDYDYDFIDDYIYQKEIDEKILAKSGLDRRIKGKMRNGQKLKKIDIYRFGFILKMKKEEIIQLMMMCNHNFNPDNELDLFYIDYLNGKYPNVKTLVDISILSFDKCGETLTW